MSMRLLNSMRNKRLNISLLAPFFAVLLTFGVAQAQDETKPLGRQGSFVGMTAVEIAEYLNARDAENGIKPRYDDGACYGVECLERTLTRKMRPADFAVLGDDCDEKKYSFQNAVTSSEDIAAVKRIEVNVIGEDDRMYISDSATHELFAGVGKVICTDPVTGKSTGSTMTLAGDQKTIVGAGHYRTQAKTNTIFKRENCKFSLFDMNGNEMRPSYKIKSEKLAQPPEKYINSKVYTQDWAVLTLENDIDPLLAKAIPLKQQSIADVVKPADTFMVAYHFNSRINGNKKIISPNCYPSNVSSSDSVFSHQCDIDGGSSGGLIYRVSGGKYEAIGISKSGSLSGEKNYGNIFPSTMLAYVPNSGTQLAEAPDNNGENI